MADFEAFRRVMSSSIKLLFLKNAQVEKKSHAIYIVKVKIQIEFLLILFRMEEATGESLKNKASLIPLQNF